MVNIKGTSKELQEIAMVGLLNDPYILGKTIEHINESFFENINYRIIYRCLKTFYIKYNSIPSEKELSVLIVEQCSKDNFVDTNSVLSELSELLATEIASEDFIYEKVIDFIRRNKVENTLSKVVTYISNGEIDMEQVSADLVNDIHITLTGKQPVYNLADIENIANIREESLGSVDSPMLIKFFIDAVNRKMQYKALPPGTLNMVSASPGCGKTTLMINQGMYSAQNGYKVLHIFLGDMSKYDGLLRYLSNKSGVPTNTLVDMSPEELSKFVIKNNFDGSLSNIYLASYAQCELTATQLIEEISIMQKQLRVHFDLIIVDYDENISKDDDNIYESGGLVYNKLGLFAVTNKSVIFIVSQPKPQYWNSEIIPLEGSAESSKKQKIIDTMITMGKPFRGASVGSLFIAKNRRGEVGNIMRVKIDGATTRITHITQAEYDRIKQMEQNNADGVSDDDEGYVI